MCLFVSNSYYNATLNVAHFVQVSPELQHVWHDLPPLEMDPFALVPYVQAQASSDPGK